eukprot:SAG22_NODE_3557_length_1643_cov_1.872409_1_plen_425_part_00
MPDALFERNPQLADLCGRGETANMLCSKTGVDSMKFMRMTGMARGTYDKAKFDESLVQLSHGGPGGDDAGANDKEDEDVVEASEPTKAAGAWTIVVHGGAGAARDELESPQRMCTLRAAVAAGTAILGAGGASLDAVQAAVEMLEDSEHFNAGRGSAFHALGGHEMDAALMDGRADLRCGAVAGLRATRHPIQAARHVLESSEHVFFSADGAERVALEGGVEQAPERWFGTDLRREQLRRELAEQEQEQEQEQVRRADPAVRSSPREPRSNGTVGAVALDSHGDLAAATSTGGMTAKPPGRIGDTPVIGAGTFANNATCAVSGTGNGELFLSQAVASTIAAFVEMGLSVTEAAARVIAKLPAGSGGVIAVDKHGEWAAPFNSDVLFRGYASSASCAADEEGDGITLAVQQHLPGPGVASAAAKL